MQMSKSLIELSNEEVVAAISVANGLELPRSFRDSVPTGAQLSESHWDRHFIMKWLQGRFGMENGFLVEYFCYPSSVPLEENEQQRVADYVMTMKSPGWHLAPTLTSALAPAPAPAPPSAGGGGEQSS